MNDAATLNKSGIEALQRGQLAEGKALLEAAAAQKPRDVRYLADVAQAQLMNGQTGRAVETFRRCVELDPDFAPAWLNLGILMIGADRIEEAGNCFEKTVEIDPKQADGFAGLGYVRIRQDRLPDAVAAFDRAATLQPRNPEFIANLAGVLLESGEFEKAISGFKQAIALSPQQASLHTNLGVAEHEAHGGEAALPHYNAALDLTPKDSRTLASKGAALVALNRREEATQIFDNEVLISTTRISAAPGYANMQDFNSDLAKHAVSHPTLIASRPGKSTRGGGQTGQILGPTTGPIAALESIIRGALDDYASAEVRTHHPYCPSSIPPYRIMAWATVLDKGGCQDAHIHPNGSVSGVYYVQLPGEGGPHEETGAIEFGRPPARLSAVADPEVKLIQPQAGLLVLFPSFFWHRTIPFSSAGQRISIAFDLIAEP